MGTAQAKLDGAAGGRLTSMKIGGFELLHSPSGSDPPPTAGGAYPMVPWAGRIDRGRFSFNGEDYQMPINFGDHAIHGTGFTSNWTMLRADHAVLDLVDPWPFGGTASHRITSAAKNLTLELAVHAGERAMPVMVGWHPWFTRQLTVDGAPVELSFADYQSAHMYELDDNQIPTGAVDSPPPPGPWDHPFRAIIQPLTLTWPGQLQLELRSSCDHWVIFDELASAVCVEAQSGPPDIFNPERFDLEPDILKPGESLRHTLSIDWTLL